MCLAEFVWQEFEIDNWYIENQRLSSRFMNKMVATESNQKRVGKMKDLSERGNASWYETFGVFSGLISKCLKNFKKTFVRQTSII